MDAGRPAWLPGLFSFCCDYWTTGIIEWMPPVFWGQVGRQPRALERLRSSRCVQAVSVSCPGAGWAPETCGHRALCDFSGGFLPGGGLQSGGLGAWLS